MFERTYVEDGDVSRRPWAIAVSLLTQSLFVCLGALIPLLYTNALPLRGWVSRSLAEPPPELGGSPQELEPARQPKGRVLDRFDTDRLLSPTKIPERVSLITEESELPPFMEVSRSDPGVGLPVGVLDSVGLGGEGIAGLLARPQMTEDAGQSQPEGSGKPVEVGGDVQAARLLHRVTPVYPSLARQARIGGVVRLRAIISEDGAVRRLEVLSGHPLLVGSAVEAVKRWLYRPTLLNGRPVAVITQIDVNFRLR